MPAQLPLVLTWKSLNKTRPHCLAPPTGVLKVYSSGMPAQVLAPLDAEST